MSKKNTSFPGNGGQRGNAMVYVLIIVALFGALSYVLARQGDTSEAGGLSKEQTEIYAGTIQQAAAQLKQSVEQMTFTGTPVSALDFMTPDDADFEDQPVGNKVFHPHGGGVIMPRLPNEALNQVNATPPARWYVGRFNNVEWTPSAAQDVILTAHQLSQQVCARINFKLTGSETIPVLADPINKLFIDFDTLDNPETSNINFTSAQCAVPGECFGKPSLCVRDNTLNIFSFYSIIAAE